MATEAPFGAMVVVRRGSDYLLLRRAGAQGLIDWEWTPPSGTRQPGESIEACAARELAEETGLAEVPLSLVLDTGEWFIWVADVGANTHITLDREHTEFRWLKLDQAMRLCRPSFVAEGIALAAAKAIDAAG
jgi:8-oxo-dGTP pyrophosphatase MutT (NUDIX family)